MKKYIIAIAILLSANIAFAQKVLTLEESKQLTLQNNTKVKNGALEIEASRQILKAAVTKYFPSISAAFVLESSPPITTSASMPLSSRLFFV